jgi:hypothetical protein
VEAPAALGHVPERPRVERAPEVLLKAGLADGLAARLAGQVEATGYRAERDPGTKVVNPQAISDYSPLLANAVVVPAAIRSSVCERMPQAPCHGVPRQPTR